MQGPVSRVLLVYVLDLWSYFSDIKKIIIVLDAIFKFIIWYMSAPLYSLANALLTKCSFSKEHFSKEQFTMGYRRVFLKSKRAFSPNRQKPNPILQRYPLSYEAK